MQIDGAIDGHIYVDKTMVISESGSANGEVYADHIIVNGLFEGTCYASRIEILNKGKVTGTLYTDDLSIEQGGRFTGVTHPSPDQQVVDFKEAKTVDKVADHAVSTSTTNVVPKKKSQVADG